MTKANIIEIEKLKESFGVYYKALLLNLTVVVIRVLSYFCSLIWDDQEKTNYSTSYHIFMLFLIVFAISILYHLLVTYPLHYSVFKNENINTVNLSNNQVMVNNKYIGVDYIYVQRFIKELSKHKTAYITNVGMVLLVGDLASLLFKQICLCGKSAFYLEYTEIYLCNVFLCIFVVKNYRYCLVCIFASIAILNFYNFYFMNDSEFIDNCATSFNCMIGSTLIMWACEKEAKENIEGKVKLKESEVSLKNILEMFPSGILFKISIYKKTNYLTSLFYNKMNGVFYKNKYCIIDEQRMLDIQVNVENNSKFKRLKDNNLAKDSKYLIFDSLFLKDSSKITLKEEIEYIYETIYSSDNLNIVELEIRLL